MYQKNWVHYLTKVLIDVMFYGGILFCITIPFTMPWFANILGYSQNIVKPYIIILIISGICSLYILWQLRRMFKSLMGGNPFTLENVSCLRKCSVAGFLMALIYLVKICIWFTIASSIIVIVFAILGLFCLTLKDVFKQAVTYKEENDWTV